MFLCRFEQHWASVAAVNVMRLGFFVGLFLVLVCVISTLSNGPIVTPGKTSCPLHQDSGRTRIH